MADQTLAVRNNIMTNSTYCSGNDVYSEAIDDFKKRLNRLDTQEVHQFEHGDIEKLINEDGTELLRKLLQGSLDLRALNEYRRIAVKGADGIIRSHYRKGCSRNLESMFGEVAVTRMGYSAKNSTSIFPLDAELNLPPDKYSHELRKRAVIEVSNNSFDETVDSLIRNTGGKIPKRQAEQVAVDVSKYYVEFYEQRRIKDLKNISEDKKKNLYWS